jgi:hypothetical protein
MAEEKSIRILLEPDELEQAQLAARAVHVDLQTEPRPEIIPAIAVVLVAGGALLVGKFVVDLIDRLRGGVVIDLRPDATNFVSRNRDVPYGWAVVRAAGGTVSINVHDAPKDASERLLGMIIDGVIKSAGEVAEEAVKSLGADKVEQDPPSS